MKKINISKESLINVIELIKEFKITLNPSNKYIPCKVKRILSILKIFKLTYVYNIKNK